MSVVVGRILSMSLITDVPVSPGGASSEHSPEAARVELDVFPIDGDGWRVSIRGADRGNPFALLGFVSREASHSGPRFLVCVIGRPGDELVAGTLDEAIELLRPRPAEVEAILAGIRH